MNRLALIAATGFLALTLTACGDHSKPAAGPADNAAVQQPQDQAAPAPAQEPAAPVAPAAPAEGQH